MILWVWMHYLLYVHLSEALTDIPTGLFYHVRELSRSLSLRVLPLQSLVSFQTPLLILRTVELLDRTAEKTTS